MKFEITSGLARPADEVDLSPATTATRNGPAAWAEDGRLEIPFDRDLSPEEVAAVTLLLTSPTNTEAALRDHAQRFLAIAQPTAADNTAMLKNLARLVLELSSRS